jgi:hypothetical protein
MKILLIVGLILAGLYGLDRFLLWCEARGWIYWRKRQGTAVSARNAALHMQSLIEPGKTYQIEEEQSEREEEDDEGAPPGGTGRKKPRR